ncbi:hypothetical protein B0H21DRAFT_823658 [Amylocystis lapponica]|nr:hypothetical protein B0H21DRAFT_823658 [Amylocystis lapponica]
MVVLNPRFATLATLTSIAAMSMLPAPAEGAAIQARYLDNEAAATHHSSHSHSLTESSTSPTSTDEAKPAHESKPVLPLPPVLAATGDDRCNKDTTGSTSHKGRSGSDVRKGDSDSDGHKGNSDSDSHGEGTGEDKHKAADKSRAKHEKDKVGNIWVGAVQHRPGLGMKVTGAPPMVDKRHHDHDGPNAAVKRDSDDSDFHRSLHLLGRSLHDRVVVSGNDDHVDIHNEHHGDHDKLIVTGNGIVSMLIVLLRNRATTMTGTMSAIRTMTMTRTVSLGQETMITFMLTVRLMTTNGTIITTTDTTTLWHHDDHHGHYDDYDHDKILDLYISLGITVIRTSLLTFSDILLKTTTTATGYLCVMIVLVSNGINGLDVNVQVRRDENQSTRVPGSIDIMTPVTNSTTGQRIAPLVLSQASNNDTDDSDNSTTVTDFVLNASGANHTQLYLVTIPSDTNSMNPTNSNSDLNGAAVLQST